MQTATRYDYPNIAPCLVFPFDGYRAGRELDDPALVFARRGCLVLFAAEATREFGVALIDDLGLLTCWEHYPTLDLAARQFLSKPAMMQ